MKALTRTCAVLLALIAGLLTPAHAEAQMSERALGEKIANAVRTYSQFTIFDDINIEMNNRVVTLTGRVTAPRKKDDIAARIAKIDGVRSVVNEIGVLPVSQTDADLRWRVANAIYNHPMFWSFSQMANPPLHIIVEHGNITLTGVVDSQVEKALANSLAQVSGAFVVTNRLRISAP